MKGLAAIFISCLIIFGGISITPSMANMREKSMYLKIPAPKIIDDGKFVRISLDEELYIMAPGKPMLPRLLKVFELPFGARNVRVEVDVKEFHELSLSKKIMPAPAPMPLTLPEEHVRLPSIDAGIYSSHKMYPSGWYSYRVGCGLNGKGQHVTFVVLNIYPVRYIPAEDRIIKAGKAEIRITYQKPEKMLNNHVYDLVIIAPSEFSSELERLVEHKEKHGVRTILKTTEEIYSSYSGRDEPEKIKYFIKDAIEKYGIKYVLLVGGLKSLIYAKPRDNPNAGVKGWYVPVRYSNLVAGEPGYPCDLYYADIYKEGGEFDDWDSNGNGIFAEWKRAEENEPPEDIIDLYPDVAVGRLACRNVKEVRDVVDKIINYENNAYGKEWTKRILVVSGDGFLDQQDLNIKWDVKNLSDGEYTIYAQSINDEGESGPIDVTHVTIDHNAKTKLTFNHDDYKIAELQNGYPAPPIAKIVSVSNGDVLGNTDYHYTPTEREAYCNEIFHWANIRYENGVLTIRGKSYDPEPYGNVTSIHVWVKNENDEIVFQAWRNNTEMYYEGEWVTGEKVLHGRGGALYYMPSDYEKEILWTSNGKYTGQNDVINAFSKGYGLAFLSGHGSPGFWGDHLPGIPGNRQHAQLEGLLVSQVMARFPFIGFPFFPMKKLSNIDMPSVVVVGGCHNSLFNVSLIPSMLDLWLLIFFGKNIWMHTYGQLVPECWGWYMVKLPRTGAIATIGNTGYGWGWEGEWCTVGAGDGWITSEFFRQYGEKGYHVLGEAHLQTITTYIHHFKEFTLPECWWYPDLGWDWVDEKTVQEWVLLGDPSLMIGGYP